MSHLSPLYQSFGQSANIQSLSLDSESRLHSAASSVFDFPLYDSTNVNTRSRGPTPLTRQDIAAPKDRDNNSYLVISGGTGCNSILSAFGDQVTYVLPVSDNGGSSSEIIRVLGQPV
ncbi:hypothetical protein FRC03_001177 [Tulasnella sp. 419]|nr:hypothetical protein FRC03_001177 [Tulasnella sp. 419]